MYRNTMSIISVVGLAVARLGLPAYTLHGKFLGFLVKPS
jgi:hypothetical protein